MMESHQCFSETDKYFEGRCWVYLDDGEIIGVVGLRKCSDDRYELERMCVKVGVQRKGVGRKLIQALESHCVDHGIPLSRIFFTSSNIQFRAIQFYQSLGYEYEKISMLHDEHIKKNISGYMRNFKIMAIQFCRLKWRKKK